MIYNPINPADADEPFERLKRLRAECPVYRPFESVWVVADDASIRSVMRDHQAYSNYQNGTLVPMPDDELILSQLDPPRHTRIRRFFQAVLNPRAVASLEPLAVETCSSLIKGFAHRGEVDLMEEFAGPFPALMTIHLLGMDTDRLDDLKRWVDDFFAYCINGFDAIPSWEECKAYLHGLIEERRNAADPPDDFLSRLVEAEIEGSKLSDVDIRSILFIFNAGGLETTAGHLGSLVLSLIENDLWDTVRNDRSLVEPAIEESLRLDPPVAWMMRQTTSEQVLGGRTIPEGDRLFVAFQSANRDEAVWSDPESYRLDRENGRDHLAFGHGIHFCVGAPLARLEARIGLNALLDALPDLQLSPDFVYERHHSLMLRAPRHLPVTFTPNIER
jgi:cytochrome P450